MDERLTIGDLAKATGTKVVTVRYYEQTGLLPVPPRTDGNYRAYGADHLHRLRFIRRCRDLGFTLGQVRALLRLSSQEDQPCAEVNRISAEHLAETEAKIADDTVGRRAATDHRPLSGGGGDRRLPDYCIAIAVDALQALAASNKSALALAPQYGPRRSVLAGLMQL